MSWTITVFGDCDNQYVVDCSTTGSIECENFDEEIVYQRQGVNCPVALYKSDF
ncbi:MAG: hypothetical protein V3V28_02705 [Polaribacter sp.]|uniref:hypothetical protein n=1 Tax=Polaribacter sp. TaxID=1920175 RepID=UPI002F357FE1